MTATLEKWYHKKWYVVCVKDARGYTKGLPMMGYFETREDATARAAAMSIAIPVVSSPCREMNFMPAWTMKAF